MNDTEFRMMLRESLGDGLVWGTEDELRNRIAQMEPDEIANNDYVDTETGEVYLDRGKPARSSHLHPQNKVDRGIRDAARKAEHEKEEAEWATEDTWEAEQREAYDRAVREYVEEWRGFGTEHDPEGTAPDAARDFFNAYPEWQQWSRSLRISKREMQETLQDLIASAMRDE